MNVKCLFIFRDAPLSPNFSGGASRYFQSFHALHRLGIDVYVWRLLSIEERDKIYRFEREEEIRAQEVRQQAADWFDIPYSHNITVGWGEIAWRSLFDPKQVVFKEYLSLRDKLLIAVLKVRPDFIWAEHVWSAALATTMPRDIPWVYAHHDWLYKVRRVRQTMKGGPRYLSDRVLLWALKRAETSLVRQSCAVVTGSTTEAEELAELGARFVQVIPTTYPPVDLDLQMNATENKVRIVHLGSLTTTANYQGLMAYLVRAHPALTERLRDKEIELVIVGDTSHAKPDLLARLHACNAVLTGHVRDLSYVLRPFDIAIIPYEMDTGTRTKVGLLFNYAQAVVTTQAAVAGISEIEAGRNCLVVPSVDDFPEAIARLARAPEERERLGRAAKETFERHFTLEAQLPRFEKVLSALSVV